LFFSRPFSLITSGNIAIFPGSGKGFGGIGEIDASSRSLLDISFVEADIQRSGAERCFS
jgi:hypothetical protein